MWIGVALVFTVLSAKPPESIEQVFTRELGAALTDFTSRGTPACLRLHEALVFFWGADDELEWPRQMRVTIPPALGGWRKAGDACVEAMLVTTAPEGVLSGGRVLFSPLLNSEGLHDRALARARADKVVETLADGGVSRAWNDLGTVPRWRSKDPMPRDPVVTGPLKRELAKAALRSAMTPVRYCYDRQLEASPKLRGTVTVRFEVTPAGLVTGVALEASTLGNVEVEACVLRRITWATFPALERGPVVIVQAFDFAPR